MSRTQKQVKKFEKRFANNVSKGFGSLFKKIGTLFVRIFKFLDNKLTIMIVPHSKSKVINFQTNVFALFLTIFLTIGIFFSFFYFNSRSISANMTISNLETQNKEALASLDLLRDENTNLFQAAKRFQTSLSQSLSLLGINKGSTKTNNNASTSDLSSLFSTKDITTGSSREIADIRELTSYLEGAIEPIEQIGKMLKTQQSLFTEIPSICPLVGPNLHVSMSFGPNIHPTKGNWYIHKGIDFSTYRSGDPVLAAASGQVVTVGYDSGYGSYIILKHNHGFYTRYAHLNSFRISKGQIVNQGDVIGTCGSTGLVTGPHLHYEVHIGSDVVDPAKYVNIKLSKK
ncbi:MAG: M23 family metallopeptidase [Treponema sp.]|nr:M23 family metallopeptidase [Treponema sp.]